MSPFHTLCVIAFLVVIACIAPGCAVTEPSVDTINRVRKNVTSLTVQERTDFIDALKKLKSTKSPYDSLLNYYDQFVYWHLKAFYCTPGAGHAEMYPAHMTSTFLPWHRVYLNLFENCLLYTSDAADE